MNWGNRLLVAFLLFGAGIFYLVYRSMNTNFELVEKDYYKSELQYQQVIDRANMANALATTVKAGQQGDTVLVQLPDEMNDKAVSGELLFYCAYDEKKDRRFPLRVNTAGIQEFEPGTIAPGTYTVKINWSCEGKNYYTEKSLTVN